MAQYKTFVYKKLDTTQPFLLEVYFPPLPTTDVVISLPVLVFFHGGALLVGDRQSALPTWLIERALSLGYAFVSADYRLLMPSTAHEVVEDLKDVFKYVSSTKFKGDDYTFHLDQDRIAVCGNSAGGLCAYLATIHCFPRPKVLISIYGQGGNFFTSHNLDVKRGGMKFMGMDLAELNTSHFASLAYPSSKDLPTLTGVPFGTEYEQDPAVIAEKNPRMMSYSFFLQEGNYLDHYTGLHEPGISQELRRILHTEGTTVADFKNALPNDKHSLFPQLSIDAHWPPTILIHGTIDDVVPIDESRNIKRLVEDVGAAVQLIEVEGQHHGFDGFPGVGEAQKANFELVKDFLQKYL